MNEEEIKKILRKEGAKNIEISEDSGYKGLVKIAISMDILVYQFGEILKKLNIARNSWTSGSERITMYMRNEG